MDTIDEADLEVTQTTARRIRTGFVKDIAVDSTPDSIVLEKAFDALIAAGFTQGSAYHTSVPDRILTNYRIKAIPGFISTVRVYLTYDSINLGGSPTAYIIRTRGGLWSTETTRIPGTRTPILADWINPVTLDQYLDPTPVKFRFDLPLKQISFSAIVAGELGDDDKSDFTGYVNESPWKGFPKGYWRLDSWETDVSKYTGYHTVDATATTKIVEDWSHLGTMFNPYIGMQVKTDPATETTLAGHPYAYGLIHPEIYAGTGIVHVGPSKTTDFAALFGFS